MNKYTIKQFRVEFPNDRICLDYVFNKKFSKQCQVCKRGKLYRVNKRKCYACSICASQIHPLANTIFEKSSTPLTQWFFALYLFSASRNGVSAKELQRHLGTTYKTAWRIAKQIRSLMKDDDILGGEVEVDETYVGGKHSNELRFKSKTPVLGMVQRKGKVKTKTLNARETHLILNEIKKNVRVGSHIISDQFGVYKKTKKLGYSHSSVNH